MQIFRFGALKAKITVMIAITAVMVMCLFCLVWVGHEVGSARHRMDRITDFLTGNIAKCQSEGEVQKLFNELGFQPQITAGGLYNTDSLIASYSRSNTSSLPSETREVTTRSIGATWNAILGVSVVKEVRYSNGYPGWIYIQQEFYLPQLGPIALIGSAGFLGIVVLAFVASGPLQQMFLGRLLTTMQEIANRYTEDFGSADGAGQDYLRLSTYQRDGLGEVILAFNGLVNKIHGRDQALRRQNAQLETDVRARTAELLAAKERAEAATLAKSEFLANMSHEIRTPLNGVVGMLELLRHTNPNVEQAELVSLAQDSADCLLAVINDILDFSKIEAGKLEFDSVEFDLRETVSGAVRALAPRAHQKKLELAYDVDLAVPPFFVGDPARLKQILLNLAGNAVKFTTKGEIVVRVQGQHQQNDAVALRFSVSDTGIGIPPHLHKLIFESFSQADASTTRKFGGTGLGLTISSRLVNQMGGEMWVESEPGKGSTFYFTCTLKIGTGVNTHECPSSGLDLRGTRVLIVDDNAANLEILRRMVSHWGMVPTTAAAAVEGLKCVKDATANETPFPLVLVDYHMPDMNGLVLADEIRQLRLPPAIMMLTSDDYAATARECKARGISSYLIKPIKESELLPAMMSALWQTSEGGKRIPPSVEQSVEGTPSLNILLAEDNTVNQKLAVSLLKRLGHQITVVENGKQALDRIEGEEFDVVFMDVQMPEMDGITATKFIRDRQQSNERLPIIAMTAHAMKGDRERMLAAGMDDYISKPISLAQLAETIHRVIKAATNQQPISEARITGTKEPAAQLIR